MLGVNNGYADCGAETPGFYEVCVKSGVQREPRRHFGSVFAIFRSREQSRTRPRQMGWWRFPKLFFIKTYFALARVLEFRVVGCCQHWLGTLAPRPPLPACQIHRRQVWLFFSAEMGSIYRHIMPGSMRVGQATRCLPRIDSLAASSCRCLYPVRVRDPAQIYRVITRIYMRIYGDSHTCKCRVTESTLRFRGCPCQVKARRSPHHAGFYMSNHAADASHQSTICCTAP